MGRGYTYEDWQDFSPHWGDWDSYFNGDLEYGPGNSGGPGSPNAPYWGTYIKWNKYERPGALGPTIDQPPSGPLGGAPPPSPAYPPGMGPVGPVVVPIGPAYPPGTGPVGPLGPTGGPVTTSSPLQNLEAQIPGIGSALVAITQGWDNLNPIEKGLIIAAVALVGIEVLGALGAELGVGAALMTALRAVPILGGILGKGGGGATHSGIVPGGFVAAWKANGVQFYRNSTGMLGVMNKHGRWKQWRPRKPIVLYSTGATNLKTLFRAERALRKQVREISRAVERHTAPRARAAKEPKLTANEFRQLRERS